MVHTILISKIGSRSIFLIVSFIIVALIIDTSIIKISGFTAGWISLVLKIVIFTILVVIYAIGQYLILEFVKHKINEIIVNKQLRLNVIHKVVSITQYAVIAILISIILQMILTSGYSIFLVNAVLWINYTVSIILLGLLAKRFFSWFKFQRNSVVLVYALAISVLSINAGFTLLYVTNELMDRPTYINSMRYPIMGFYSSPDSVFYYSAYFVTLLLSFILTWFATVLILRHYSKRLGEIKYWIIVSFL